MATKPPVQRKFVQDEFTHLPHEDQHPEQHEHTDVRVRPLVLFGVGFVVFAALTNVLLFVLFRVFEEREERPSSSAFGGGVQALPVGTPPLQGIPGPTNDPRFRANTPAADMRQWRDRERRVLNEGDWSNGNKVIPIGQAMEIALRRQKDVFGNEPAGGAHDHRQHGQPQGEPGQGQQPNQPGQTPAGGQQPAPGTGTE